MNKSRIMMSLFVIALAAALIGGATMAWFTAKAEAENEFIAGTVLIDVDEIVTGEGDIENVNPGDCFTKEFCLTNSGSKAIRLRMQFEDVWTFDKDFLRDNWYSLCFDDDPDYVPTDEEIDAAIAAAVDPVTIEYITAGWVDGGDGWWYYNNDIAPDVVDMAIYVNVCFDGEDMTNVYQAADYNIDIKFEAIQASNDAAEESGWAIY